jgi:hypothetical protein
MIAAAQSSTETPRPAQETQARGYWVDTSGLMWAGKDNGKDVNWHQATKYCHNLRLAGYSDWYLPTIDELQGIYDAGLETPGLCGERGNCTWHVKGGLFLTGHEWSSSLNHDDRGRPSGSAPRFDFNDGTRFDDDLGYYTFKRALCVRGSGK